MIDVSTKESRALFYGSSEWRALRQSILERFAKTVITRDTRDLTTGQARRKESGMMNGGK